MGTLQPPNTPTDSTTILYANYVDYAQKYAQFDSLQVSIPAGAFNQEQTDTIEFIKKSEQSNFFNHALFLRIIKFHYIKKTKINTNVVFYVTLNQKGTFFIQCFITKQKMVVGTRFVFRVSFTIKRIIQCYSPI